MTNEARARQRAHLLQLAQASVNWNAVNEAMGIERRQQGDDARSDVLSGEGREHVEAE